MNVELRLHVSCRSGSTQRFDGRNLWLYCACTVCIRKKEANSITKESDSEPLAMVIDSRSSAGNEESSLFIPSLPSFIYSSIPICQILLEGPKGGRLHYVGSCVVLVRFTELLFYLSSLPCFPNEVVSFFHLFVSVFLVYFWDMQSESSSLEMCDVMRDAVIMNQIRE